MPYKVKGKDWETDFTFPTIEEAVDFKIKTLRNWKNAKTWEYVRVVQSQ